MWHEEDDTLQKEIEREIELTEEFDLLNVQFADKHNGKTPISRLDLGRNCVKCAGRLVLKEITEKNQNVFLQCKSCGFQVFAEDIDFEEEIPDKLYRSIPLTMQHRWNKYRENYRHKR